MAVPIKGPPAWWKSDVVLWEESQANNGLAAIDAVTDPTARDSGDNVQTRDIVDPKIAWLCAGGANLVRVQLRTAAAFENINPEFDVVRTLTGDGSINDLYGYAPPVAPNDNVQAFCDNGNTLERNFVAVSLHYGALPDRKPREKPLKLNRLTSIRVAHNAVTANAWTDDTVLPTGLNPKKDYVMLGWLPFSANGIAARLRFQDSPLAEGIANYRPGVPMLAAANLRDVNADVMRNPIYFWGEDGIRFSGQTPPNVSFYANGADSPVSYYLIGEL